MVKGGSKKRKAPSSSSGRSGSSRSKKQMFSKKKNKGGGFDGRCAAEMFKEIAEDPGDPNSLVTMEGAYVAGREAWRACVRAR